MPTERNRTWLPIAIIAGALLGWMGLLAAGAYWASVGEDEGGDFRKLWVVVGTTGGFLLLWGLVLVIRLGKVRGGRGNADGEGS